MHGLARQVLHYLNLYRAAGEKITPKWRQFTTSFFLRKAAWISILLIFTHCQSLPEVEPATAPDKGAANARIASSVQTVTTMDGAITQVNCKEEILPSGEIIQICIPALWNGELILYAHGYVTEFEPLRLPQEAAAYIPLYTSLGFAFATTSFAQNGLAIQSGIQDIINLRSIFIKQYGQPKQLLRLRKKKTKQVMTRRDFGLKENLDFYNRLSFRLCLIIC